jgi:hypothetical protein
VLEAARKLSPRSDRTFTAAQLANEGQIADTEKSRGSQIASAWLSKFVRWGYVNFVEKIDAGGIRPTNTYVVTEVGHECEVTEGCPSKLASLIGAVRAFEKARKTPREEAAYKALLQVTGEIEG